MPSSETACPMCGALGQAYVFATQQYAELVEEQRSAPRQECARLLDPLIEGAKQRPKSARAAVEYHRLPEHALLRSSGRAD